MPYVPPEVRIDQAVFDELGNLTGSISNPGGVKDPRYLVPGVAPTSQDFYTMMKGTLPTNWYPLDQADLATVVNGRGTARDLGIFGSLARLQGYESGSRGTLLMDNRANAINYEVDLDGLRPNGIRVGRAHVPASTIPNPTSLEFNRIDSGMGTMTAPVAQSIIGTNSTFNFFFRAKSWVSRKHEHAPVSYTTGKFPNRSRIVSQDNGSGTTFFAFDVNAVGMLECYWAGLKMVSDRLNLNQLYQVTVVSTPYKVTLLIDGKAIRAENPISGPAGSTGVGGVGTLRVGSIWTENFGQMGFQGEVSNIAIWNYAMDVYMNWYGRPYIASYAEMLRRPALLMGSPVSLTTAGKVSRAASIPMRMAVRTSTAQPVTKTDGPEPPSDKFGMSQGERIRLLTSSIQNMKLALVTTVGGEAAAGTEISGGGYTRKPVLFTVDPTTGVATSIATLRYEDIPACSLMGWELWSGTERRWYGYWSLATGDQVGTVITATQHGLSNGDKVIFATNATPQGATPNTTYYVRDATASTFKVSATSGGSVVALTDGGTVRFGRALELPVPDSVEVEAGHLKLTLG